MLSIDQAKALMEKALNGKYKIISIKDIDNYYVFIIDTPDEGHEFIDPIAIDKNTCEIKLYSPVNNFGRSDDG